MKVTKSQLQRLPTAPQSCGVLSGGPSPIRISASSSVISEASSCGSFDDDMDDYNDDDQHYHQHQPQQFQLTEEETYYDGSPLDSFSDPQTKRVRDIAEFSVGSLSGSMGAYLSLFEASPLQWIVLVLALPIVLLEVLEFQLLTTSKEVNMVQVKAAKRYYLLRFCQGCCLGLLVGLAARDWQSHGLFSSALCVTQWAVVWFAWTLLIQRNKQKALTQVAHRASKKLQECLKRRWATGADLPEV